MYNKFDFVISQNQICDITLLFLWYNTDYFLFHIFFFCDITKSCNRVIFFISQKQLVSVSVYHKIEFMI